MVLTAVTTRNMSTHMTITRAPISDTSHINPMIPIETRRLHSLGSCRGRSGPYEHRWVRRMSGCCRDLFGCCQLCTDGPCGANVGMASMVPSGRASESGRLLHLQLRDHPMLPATALMFLCKFGPWTSFQASLNHMLECYERTKKKQKVGQNCETSDVQ